MKMKSKIAFPLAFALAASPALAGNAELQYESQLFIAGFLIRAGGACPMTGLETYDRCRGQYDRLPGTGSRVAGLS
jgi:hypothetical protein